MPKKTFFNLNDEKKEKIENAAFNEFAEYGYQTSSVNRIVKAAGIATGSFYQYFDDIEDLFIHILIIVARQKFKYIKDEYSKIKEHNLESLIKALYIGGTKFAVENQVARKIGDSIISIKNTNIITKLTKMLPKDEILDWLYIKIQESIDKGEIREGITPQLFVMIMNNINMSIIDYIFAKQNNKNIWNDENLNEFCNLAVSILFNGIKSN